MRKNLSPRKIFNFSNHVVGDSGTENTGEWEKHIAMLFCCDFFSLYC